MGEEYWEEFGEDEWIPDPNEPVPQPEHPAEFINVRVQNNMDGTSTVYYTPKWIGEYQISLYYAETEIKNSPFNCDIIKNPTPPPTPQPEPEPEPKKLEKVEESDDEKKKKKEKKKKREESDEEEEKKEEEEKPKKKKKEEKPKK